MLHTAGTVNLTTTPTIIYQSDKKQIILFINDVNSAGTARITDSNLHEPEEYLEIPPGSCVKISVSASSTITVSSSSTATLYTGRIE